MKKLLLVLACVCAFGSVASAAEKETSMRAFGGLKTSNSVVSGSGGILRGVSWAASSTSGSATVSLYDAASLGAATNANGVFEFEAAPAAGAYIAFNPPIRVKNGVSIVMQNVVGAVVYLDELTP